MKRAVVILMLWCSALFLAGCDQGRPAGEVGRIKYRGDTAAFDADFILSERGLTLLLFPPGQTMNPIPVTFALDKEIMAQVAAVKAQQQAAAEEAAKGAVKP